MKNKVTPAAYYRDDSFVKVRQITIPEFLVRPLMGQFLSDRDDLKSISEDSTYDHLLTLGRRIRRSGGSQLEVKLNIWARNIERCIEPVSEKLLKEIFNRAMHGDDEFDLPDYQSIEIENWKLVPDALRWYFYKIPIRLHEHQVWMSDMLVNRYQQNHSGMPTKEILAYLNERLKICKGKEDKKISNRLPGRNIKLKTSEDLHNWCFKSGQPGDGLLGKGRLFDTNGVGGGRGYVTFNPSWNPLKDDEFMNSIKKRDSLLQAALQSAF